MANIAKHFPFLLKHTKRMNRREGNFFMDFFIQKTIFEAVVMILIGFIALRLVGRKSLSKLTLSQAVIMIAIGSILIEPVKKKELDVTILTIFLFVIVLLLLEYLALKFPIFEQFLVGKPQIVIENGKINYRSLRKLRLTEDQLDMLLRQNKIGEVADVKVGILEANGNFAYEVVEDAKSLTVREFKELTGNFFHYYQEVTDLDNHDDLFSEVEKGEADDN